MKVTYIYHSCYLLEFDGFSVIFDYYKDAKRDDEQYWIRDYLLSKTDDLYVFCTHSHSDHFNAEILKWEEKKSNITYIFSKELLDSQAASANNRYVFLDKLQSYQDHRLKATAFGSTDVGASFLLNIGGRQIFHAGDLNNWHWNQEVPKHEATAYETNFLCELELLAENTKELFLTMFPVDPRLGEDYMRGAQQFVNRICTDYFFPMHFGENYEKANAFCRFAKLQNCQYSGIHKKGQTFDIKF